MVRDFTGHRDYTQQKNGRHGCIPFFTKEKSRKGYLQKMAQSQPLPTAAAASQVPLICDRLANLSVAMDMDTQIPALHSPPAPVQPPQAVTQASPVTVLSQPPIAQPPPLIPAQPPMQIQPPVQTPASQPPTFTASDWTYHTSQFEGSPPSNNIKMLRPHQSSQPTTNDTRIGDCQPLCDLELGDNHSGIAAHTTKCNDFTVCAPHATGPSVCPPTAHSNAPTTLRSTSGPSPTTRS